MLPITLIHTERLTAVVVGGGVVGERKVTGLIEANLRVRLIAPEITSQLTSWHEAGTIDWICRAYQPGDLQEAQLAFAATNVRTVNAAVAQEAHQRGILINVADAPAAGNFHMPAVHRDHRLIVAVSTQAGRPRLAVAVRNWLAALLPNFYQENDDRE